jgi:uncharacterized membrane protein
MTWIHRHQLRNFIRTSLVLFPMACLVAALALAPVLRWLDRVIGWQAFDFSPEGARAVLGAFASSMLTFIVFILSSLLIVLQLASSQLSPRVIVQILSSRGLKLILGVFTFSYTLTLAALSRVDSTVPQLPAAVAVVSNLACILVFFLFVQQIGRRMRPTAILQMVAEETRTVIESVYPLPYDSSALQPARAGVRHVPSAQDIEHTGHSGVILAFSQADIVRLAREAGACVELVPQVGDFLSRGDLLFRVTGQQQPLSAHALRQCVAVAAERTLEQDPRFGFRILVDVACKALSPAINDPTTAVLSLDQIHHLLLDVGRRKLDDGEARDAEGTLRLVYRTPDWEDFVWLAVNEIRHYGRDSIQVHRRLRAMLDHLIRVLPDARRQPLQKELPLLQSAAERGFADEEDRSRARQGDYQGMGGAEPGGGVP